MQRDKTETLIPQVSQESLAEMLGTTRSRVNSFMNKFRRLGFIGYDGGCSTAKLRSILPGSKVSTNPSRGFFPKLAVCLHCGLAEFIVPERELQVLDQGSPVEGAIALLKESGRPSKNVKVRSVSPIVNG